MWFKTRVGLISATEPLEILADEVSDTGPKRWRIYARLNYQQEVVFKGIAASGRITNPVSYLAMFLDGPAVSEAIAGCMAVIESALLAKADICDLSQSGDAQAWAGGWTQVQWQSRDKPAA